MKGKAFTILKVVVLAAIVALAVFCLYRAAAKMNQGQQAESMKQLENSIRKATMTCYATEGVYPPTIQYLEDNYGIQIDESRFAVFYEVYAKNMMPEITVMENQMAEE